MFFSKKLLVDGLEVRYMGGYRVSGRERERARAIAKVVPEGILVT